jgi:hypothetical protein
MNRATVSVMLLVLIAIAFGGCSAVGNLNEEPIRLPSATASSIPVETFLHTDEPLPTHVKSPPASPDRSPWEIADCVDWDWQVHPVSSIQELTSFSSIVVLATFDGYGGERWNTPHGERPTSEEFLEHGYATIVRNVGLGDVSAVRGSERDLTGAYVRGGTIGCDSVTYSQLPELIRGEQYLVFIEPLPIGDATSEVLPQVIEAWRVTGDGRVETDFGTSLLAHVLDEIQP